jgi:predicted O-methyltransferase YrrM
MKSFELFTETEKQDEIEWLKATLKDYRDEFTWKSDFDALHPNDYYVNNGWFSAMDCEVYYSVIRNYKPKLIIEIGSGNTTKLAAMAKKKNDNGLRIISIDPHPASKVEIEQYADKFYHSAFEDTDVPEIDQMKAYDIFFMDSSHNIMNADVQKEYEIIWNKLPSKCLIHWHDIHLPTEYQHGYRNKETGYSDQYALLGILESHQFEILCANYWLLRTSYNEIKEYIPTVKYRKEVMKEINTICGSFWAIKK